LEYNPDFISNTRTLDNATKEKLHKLACSFDLDFISEIPSLKPKLRLDFVYSSAQIEGNAMTKSDVQTLLEMNYINNGYMYRDIAEVVNLRKAFDNTFGNLWMEVSISTLKNIHEVLSRDLLAKESLSGSMRDTAPSITGTTYTPLAPGEQLHAELKRLFTMYNTIKDSFEKAFYLHNSLCYLQYFADCNKRTARVMQTISLQNDQTMPLMLVDSKPSDYVEYRECMVEYYETGNHKPYVDFFTRMYETQMQYLSRLQELNTKPSAAVKDMSQNNDDDADDECSCSIKPGGR